MRFNLPRPRQLARNLREVAQRRPETTEEYLEANPEAWERIAEVDPHDAADILEALGSEAALEFLGSLESEQVARILEEMNDGAAAELLQLMPGPQAAGFVGAMDADEAVDVLNKFDDEELPELVGLLEPDDAGEINRLLAYPRDSAGGLMTTEVASLPLGLTAGEAIEALRRMHETLDDLSYVYVVDDDDRLKGVVSFRELVFARPGQGLDQAMVPNPVSVPSDADREVVSDLIQRYNLFAVPVVDADDRLLGIVTVEEALEAIQEEASEDMAVMVGAGSEETVRTAVRESITKRFPWIVVNLVLATIVALTIERQKDVIDDIVVLAALMPVVALLGGNGGAQSLAVVIRSMAINQVPSQMVPKVLLREARIGLAMGVAIAILSGLVAYIISGNDFDVAQVMALAVFANFSIATFAGAGIPIVLRALGLDPALASNIFLTFVTDMVGFAGFLVIATLLL
ncbi:MAG: magnesium transporter [Acidimicrobiia bacterium]|nr:magnesium transporter [Acidimicrobiia bacterium]MBT8192690.1 magnesium transporter [Acidimicrobiia bacterium]MBT8248218.1 magnesium transporter [Acidimicrobiia bacterium]NNF88764.1 magnesium transporter [Acidimicrobiia bacterium]NNL97497.1 magnesium transporter [Acidimicrobiia bacterium]